MRPKSPWKHVAMAVLWIAIGITMFSENVRTVQILGLLAAGTAAGVFLGRAIAAFRAKDGAGGDSPGSGPQ